MKINIQFLRSLESLQPGGIAMLLCDGVDLDLLRTASREKNCALIAGPIPLQGQYGMVCAVEGQLHFQPMCFLSEEQKRLFTPGTDVEIIPTPWGNLALCCEDDIFQPMYARTAALKGCTILAARVTAMEEGLLIPGPWSACQSNCLPIALALENSGRLILPCAMTPDNSGFAETQIDTEALAAAYRAFPIFKSLNRDLYRRYEEVLLA